MIERSSRCLDVSAFWQNAFRRPFVKMCVVNQSASNFFPSRLLGLANVRARKKTRHLRTLPARRRAERTSIGEGDPARRLLASTYRSICGDIFKMGDWSAQKGKATVNAIDDVTRRGVRPKAQRTSSTPTRAGKEPRKGAGDGTPGSGTALITRTRSQTRRPNMYRVLLLNDDYTTQEFVVVVLQKYFNKSIEEATRIMLHVHNHGVGECGVYTYEIAETKVTQVMDYARKHQHPLQCIMEKK
jgi:ATP-dependent Clp protease adaptor protein ClpS